MPTKQIPLISDQGVWKDGDAAGATANYPFFLNGYFEKIEGPENSRKVAYVKRPGLATTFTSAFTAGHKIHGIAPDHRRRDFSLATQSGGACRTWWWDGINQALSDKGAAPGTLGAAGRPIAYTILDGISYGANNNWAVTDFVGGALVDNAGAWTAIADADFTGLSLATNFAALDGYLFIGTTNNRIYNCELNTPTTWVSTSYLTAADYPGGLLWLSRIRNYLIVFKQNSVEFFEDVGNPTPGSPLESRKQLNRAIGCISKSSIQEVSDGIIFAGRAGSAGVHKMYKIDKNTFAIAEISNRYIEQCLTSVSAAPSLSVAASYTVDAFAEGSPGTSVIQGQSQTFSMFGKEFYTITLADPSNGSSRYTQVWDNDLKVWTTWCTSLLFTGVNDGYGFMGSQAFRIIANSGGYAFVVFVNNNTSPPSLMIWTDSAPSWQDSGSKNYIFGWVSENFDFGNLKRKFMDSVELYYDSKDTGSPSSTPTGTITFKYRDYNYNNTTNFYSSRSVPFEVSNGARAIIYRLGSFRKRNFVIDYQGNLPMRLWSVEVNYNQGETDQEG